MLVMMAGLPGTGKSTLSRALAERCGGVVLDKDAIRVALFSPAKVEYSREQDDFCQEIMLRTAEYLLSRDCKLRVFLDGRPFSRRYQREQVRAAASRLRVPLAVIECTCSEATAMARLRHDCESAAHLAGNRKPELYSKIKSSYEPLSEPRLTLNTDQPIAECLRQAEDYLTLVSRQESGDPG